MPVQWLLLKLGSRAARTFPWRYHRLVAALFGIHIRVIGKPVTGRRRADGGQSHQLGRHRHLFGGDAAVLCLQGGSGALAAFRHPGAAAAHRLCRAHPPQHHRAKPATRSASGCWPATPCCCFPKAPAMTATGCCRSRARFWARPKRCWPSGQHVKVQPVSVAFTGLHGLPMGRENRPAVCLVWRHGNGAAYLGGAEGGAAGCGGPVPCALQPGRDGPQNPGEKPRAPRQVGAQQPGR